MLGWRLAISAVLIPLLIIVFALDQQAGASAPYLLGLCLLLAARANFEMVTLLRTRSFGPDGKLTALCSCGVVAAAWYPRGNGGLEAAMLAFSVCVLLLFLKACYRYREPGKNLETLSGELLCVTYVGVLTAVTMQLRWVNGASAGYFALASAVIGPKAGDIGAYTLGRLFGRRKMVPLLSPGKTWMGGLGAILGACGGCWLWMSQGPKLFADSANWPPCPTWWVLLFGVSMGVVGLIGDLAESLIKRDVGAKDAAALMPGFGGLLDLLDSILYAGPVALLLWKLLSIAT
jgi:phosphatidate cytidylyltransferase